MSIPHCIEVYAHAVGQPTPCLVGTLRATLSRGKEIFSFIYDESWLKNKKAHGIDPALPLLRGIQYAPNGHRNFNSFLDSAPDRWGRFLMDKREAQLARQQNRSVRLLLESDYLLGVYDQCRAGALRFRLQNNPVFLDDSPSLAIPLWTSLRALEQASLSLEQENAEKNKHYSAWLNLLMAPGSSLGGARPKASVVDPQQQLWIAKFPSHSDDIDVGAWEMVAHCLAKKAGITVAEASLKKFNVRHHIFLSQRFDRNARGERIHFSSAMTMLQRTDGDDASQGVSYLEMAAFIMQQSARPLEDLEQLWRRIVFFICISNVDDHLRNHGFLLQSKGWVLAPAYDMNPVSYGNGLKLNISSHDNAQDLQLAIEVAPYFRLTCAKANDIIHAVVKSVKRWRKEASVLGLSTREQEKMSRAFRVVDTYLS